MNLISRVLPLHLLLFLLLSHWVPAQSVLLAELKGEWKNHSPLSTYSFTNDSLYIQHVKTKSTEKVAYQVKGDTLTVNWEFNEPAGQTNQNRWYLIHLERNGYQVKLNPIYLTNQSSNSAKSITLEKKVGRGVLPNDWYYLDLERDSLPGISLYKAYELLKGRTAKPVVVGIIDTGFDEMHPDLSKHLWTNKKELIGNHIDDDHNGYVDDVHGWYFLRMANQEFIAHDKAEATRVIESPVTSENKSIHLKATKEFNYQVNRLNTLLVALGDSGQLRKVLDQFGLQLKGQPLSIEALKSIQAKDSVQVGIKLLLTEIYRGQKISFSEFSNRIQKGRLRYKQVLSDELQFSYNPAYFPQGNPPKLLVGNNSPVGSDQNEVLTHGTHVAGIVVGFPGIRDSLSAQIHVMNVAAGPSSGDERDEILAKAIRYAIENGATVINISMAKRISGNKKLVDQALLLAEQKDVLVLNCAGNEFQNTDSISYFPIAQLANGHTLGNYLEVGNSSADLSTGLVYYSSNYGASTVDLFAPGTQIRSTQPNATYGQLTGTSFSSPLVARVAALLRSYFPGLTARQVKEILTKSVWQPNHKVFKPGSTQLVSFNSLCRSGGIVNAYNAILMAIQLTKTSPKIR